MFTSQILDKLQILGFLFSILFVILGAFDGLYFHIVKYKLHLHPESRLEHIIHSVRGIFLAAIGAAIFSVGPHSEPLFSGPLVVCVALIAIDLGLEVVDIYVERSSRAKLGGVSSSEMVLHVFASSCRMSALALLIIVAEERGFSPLVSTTGLLASGIALVIGAGSFAPNVVQRKLMARTAGPATI